MQKDLDDDAQPPSSTAQRFGNCFFIGLARTIVRRSTSWGTAAVVSWEAQCNVHVCGLRRESLTKIGNNGSKLLIERRGQRPLSFGGPPARLKTWNYIDDAWRMVEGSLQNQLSAGLLEV